jgi:hypothetical protein
MIDCSTGRVNILISRVGRERKLQQLIDELIQLTAASDTIVVAAKRNSLMAEIKLLVDDGVGVCLDPRPVAAADGKEPTDLQKQILLNVLSQTRKSKTRSVDDKLNSVFASSQMIKSQCRYLERMVSADNLPPPCIGPHLRR